MECSALQVSITIVLDFPTFEGYTSKPSSCLEKDDCVIYLKRKRPYYSQVQQQLFTAKKCFCDFFVALMKVGLLLSLKESCQMSYNGGMWFKSCLTFGDSGGSRMSSTPYVRQSIKLNL